MLVLPVPVDFGDVLLEGYLDLLGVFLHGVYEGLGLAGFDVAEVLLLGLVDQRLDFEIQLVFDDLGGGHAQDVGVILPSLEDVEQEVHLGAEFAQPSGLVGLCGPDVLQAALEALVQAGNLTVDLLLREGRTLLHPVNPDEVLPQQFLLRVTLELPDFAAQLEVQRDHVLVLLADGLLVAGHAVHLLQVAQLVGQCLREEFVVVLRGGHVLGEHRLILQPGVCVLRIEPVVAALVLHDLDNSAPVYFAHVLVVEVLVEAGTELLVPLFTLSQVLTQSPGVDEDLLAEGTLVFEMKFAHGLLVLVEVFVLDLLHVLHGLPVDASADLAHLALVGQEGFVDWRQHPWFAQVVEGSHNEHYHD